MRLSESTPASDPSLLLRSHWLLNLYPEAAEAGGCWRKPGPGVLRSRREPDSERAAAEAVRRARGKIRRYGVGNRLNRLGTLTYAGAGCHLSLIHISEPTRPY